MKLFYRILSILRIKRLPTIKDTVPAAGVLQGWREQEYYDEITD